MKKIAIFASGSGSNFQAIIEAVKKGELEADIALLVCDNLGAYALERAKNEEIPYFVFNAKEYDGKEAYEIEILKKLKKHEVDFIVLAGYMRLIGKTLLDEFEGRIMNIHPSLLPAFPGKDAIGQALTAKVKVSGVTVHYVDAGMDTGPIIAQKPIEISEQETKESLQMKIHQVEHELYPKVIQQLIKEGISVKK
ncbi:phosphoribosylglycinamide formyltransferase [Robertmurraya siralis]|uniref:Phosphoribosylglycinamide formyltransferase n=1 Tax=Robertmurraya siralis TaxID=77777 RepID=A0A919WKG0_9BACI|nr:phosphoribosylglycinamide formyltransferase [Robertmurraya siralis]PAE21158.1 phosphoribosylglycinamide formyltransferase [Bacillus sp. 7504-2]GIN63718.1 phosphoribosylglycinamide formyltransferase [Robertmurraya siralis]